MAETPLEVEIFYEGLSYGQAVPLDSRLNSRLGRDFGDSVRVKPHADDLIEHPSAKACSGQLFGTPIDQAPVGMEPI